MGDFSSRNSSSDKRNRKRFFSETGNSATEMHKLLTMKWLAKWAEASSKKSKAIQQLSIENDLLEWENIHNENSKKTTDISKIQLANTLSIEQIKERIQNISYSNQKNKKIIRDEDFTRFENAIFQLLYNKDFVDMNFDISTKLFIKQIQRWIKNNFKESERLDNLLMKFRPQTNNSIPHRKLNDVKYLDWDSLFNFLENLYFCEMLVQFFGNPEENSNLITINGKQYKIYYATIGEDKKWVDFILHDGENIVGIDITTHDKHINSHQFVENNDSLKMKNIYRYDKVIVLNYNFYKMIFLRFMSKYNTYTINIGINKIPQIKNFEPEMHEKFKRNFIHMMTKLERNISSDWDRHRGNNEQLDQEL